MKKSTLPIIVTTEPDLSRSALLTIDMQGDFSLLGAVLEINRTMGVITPIKELQNIGVNVWPKKRV